MALKTNYQNDVFSGKRKYNLINNSDGTISLDDVTVYNKVGDIFNADDINATNKVVNETSAGFEVVKQGNAEFKEEVNRQVTGLTNDVGAIKAVKTVTLSASKWSTSAPYTQTVTVSGVTAEDSPVIALYISGSPGAAAVKAMRKAFGYLDRAVTGNGSITFYCYEKKPAADFSVSVRGSKNGMFTDAKRERV